MTESEFDAWLLDSRNDAYRVTLVELIPLSGSVTYKLATAPYVDGNTIWDDVLASDIVVDESLDDGLSVGDFDLFDPYTVWTSLPLRGGYCRILVGDTRTALGQFVQVANLIIDNISRKTDNHYTVTITDREPKLEEKIIGATVANQSLPIIYGSPRNVTPILINPINLQYQFCEPPLVAIRAVRDRGLTPASVTKSPSTATIALGNAVTGAVTGDVSGVASSTGNVGGATGLNYNAVAPSLSLTIAAVSQTVAVGGQYGYAFGDQVKLTNSASAWMSGYITAVNISAWSTGGPIEYATEYVIDVDTVAGSGAKTGWTMSLIAAATTDGAPLRSVVASLLTRAGILTAADAIEMRSFPVTAASGYDIDLVITDEPTYADTLDYIVRQCGARLHRTASRGWALTYINISNPPAMAVELDDLLDFAEDGLEPVYKQIAVRHTKNWTVQAAGELAGGVVMTNVKKYGAEYWGKLTATTAYAGDMHDGTLNADLDSGVIAAGIELARLVAMSGVARKRYRATALARALSLVPGDTITLLGTGINNNTLIKSTSKNYTKMTAGLEVIS